MVSTTRDDDGVVSNLTEFGRRFRSFKWRFSARLGKGRERSLFDQKFIVTRTPWRLLPHMGDTETFPARVAGLS
jgi:hypothetical protein